MNLLIKNVRILEDAPVISGDAPAIRSDAPDNREDASGFRSDAPDNREDASGFRSDAPESSKGAPDARKDIYIVNGRIEAVLPAGSQPDVPAEHQSDEIIDGSHKVCMPGLVNAHTHAYMSVFRNYADDLPFAEWLFEKIAPLEDNLTPEQAYWGNMLSILEMLRTGTTCFVDMHMFPHMAVKACADSGIRALITRGLVGSDRHDEGGIRRLKEALEEIEYAKSVLPAGPGARLVPGSGAYAVNGSDSKGPADSAANTATGPKANVSFALGPHAIYTCGEDYLRYVAETAREHGLMINIHLSETKAEFSDCLREHGLTPTAYIHSLGLMDVPCILAHCVQLTPEDMQLLKDPKVSVVTNPASNMKLGNGFAPVPAMLKEGINVCLGTDGASSNNALNMFRELGLMTLVQKGAAVDSLVLSAEETYQIAVRNGYRAIGLGDEGGVVAPGKIADLILLDEEAPNFQPKHNWKAAIAYSSTGYEVTDTIVNGRVLMKDREMLTIDEERINFEIAKAVKDF